MFMKKKNFILYCIIILIFFSLFNILFRNNYIIFINSSNRDILQKLLKEEKNINLQGNLICINLQLCFPDGEKYNLFYYDSIPQQEFTSDNDDGKTREYITQNGIGITNLSYKLLVLSCILLILLLIKKFKLF